MEDLLVDIEQTWAAQMHCDLCAIDVLRGRWSQHERSRAHRAREFAQLLRRDGWEVAVAQDALKKYWRYVRSHPEEDVRIAFTGVRMLATGTQLYPQLWARRRGA